MRSLAWRPSLVLVAIATQACFTLAQDHGFLGKGAGGESLSFTLVSSTATTRTVRIRWTYPSPRTIGNTANAIASQSVEKIDCQKLTHAIIGYEVFTSADENAPAAWTSEISPSDVQTVGIDPNTATASSLVFQTVCLAGNSTPVKIPAPTTAPPVSVGSTPTSTSSPLKQEGQS